MSLYFETNLGKMFLGNSLDILKAIPKNSIDTVITDPPYGLSSHNEKIIREIMLKWLQGEEDYIPVKKKGFMGKTWDSFVPPPALWREVYQVMKPGATILVFAGSRTYDLMTLSLRLAGFEIKDTLMWLYGSGFPKAQDISKMIDKKLNAKRKVVSTYTTHDITKNGYNSKKGTIEIKETIPATSEAVQWNGWKTHGLKPAYEPIIMAMKPNENGYVENALKWNVSGLNIKDTRIGTAILDSCVSGKNALMGGLRGGDNTSSGYLTKERQGRFPTNILLDKEVAEMLDKQSGILKSGKMKQHIEGGLFNVYGKQYPREVETIGDEGGASRFYKKINYSEEDLRFFYCAKANKKERKLGIQKGKNNTHPTIKPLKLIEYLCKITMTPDKGIVLDPFLGSGTTAIACEILGRQWVGIEISKEYCEIAKKRIKATTII